MGLVLLGKEERPKCVRNPSNCVKLRQKCVKNARNTFGGEHLLDDTDISGSDGTQKASIRQMTPNWIWGGVARFWRDISDSAGI